MDLLFSSAWDKCNTKESTCCKSTDNIDSKTYIKSCTDSAKKLYTGTETSVRTVILSEIAKYKHPNLEGCDNIIGLKGEKAH